LPALLQQYKDLDKPIIKAKEDEIKTQEVGSKSSKNEERHTHDKIDRIIDKDFIDIEDRIKDKEEEIEMLKNKRRTRKTKLMNKRRH
jgi:hypothetical protein